MLELALAVLAGFGGSLQLGGELPLHSARADAGNASRPPPPPPPPPGGPFVNIGNPHLVPVSAFQEIQPGELVATYCPDLVWPGVPDPQGACVKIVRDPLDGPLGANWTPFLFSNQSASNPADQWTIANLGPVFGCCLDTEDPPNVYVTASTVYGSFPSSWGPGGPGGVYKLDGSTAAISVFASLPNTGVGLGDITYDRAHDQFFVSNFEDGSLYRLSSAGVTLQVYDPWVADTGPLLDPGFAPLGERIWAVHSPRNLHFSSQVLVFSGWLADEARPFPTWPASWPAPVPATPNNAVFNVGLNPDGSIDTLNPPALVVLMPPFAIGGSYSNPVSDIDSVDGRLLTLAEHRMAHGNTNGLGIGHQARVLRYWYAFGTPFGNPLLVGDVVVFGVQGANSAGGIANELTPQGALLSGDGVWCSGDALTGYGPGNYLYGVQRIPWAGNSTATPPSAVTNLIDLDLDIDSANKAQPGDVEYYTGPLP